MIPSGILTQNCATYDVYPLPYELGGTPLPIKKKNLISVNKICDVMFSAGQYAVKVC